MPDKNCLYCGGMFATDHGNLNYCPGKNCAYLAKVERQNRKYSLREDAKKAIQRNHNLFMTFLGNKNYIEVALLTLLKPGFDQNGFYGTGRVENTSKVCYRVHDCYFHITSDKPPKIQIWKIQNN